MNSTIKKTTLFLGACMAFQLGGIPQMLAAPSTSMEVMQQTKRITGTVKDATGMEVIGANVIVKGTTNGVITDLDGKFSLEAAPGSIIEISYIGYMTQEIPVTAQTSDLQITLKEDSQSLDEVVVVGYGVQKKKLVTGATLQVKGENIQKLNTTNPLGALQSQSPGVNIVANSGQPGKSFDINIRGAGTNGSTTPLYIIDGVEGDINSLSPADIESLDVLKDAASAAIYGSRAANGVVLITTKQGKQGKLQVSYDGYVGFQNVYKMPDLLNAKEYMAVMDQLNFNTGNQPYTWTNYMSQEQYNRYMSGEDEGTNWLDAIRNKNAITTSHSLNLAGGTERSKFSTGVSYTKQEGTLGKPVASDYQRFTVRMNSEHILWKEGDLDIITFGENLYYNHNESSGISEGNQYGNDISWMLRANPLVPIYNENGDYYMYDDLNKAGWFNYNSYTSNPIAAMVNSSRGNNKSKNYGLTMVGYLKVQPIKGLVYKGQVSYKQNSSSYRGYSPAYKLTSTDQKLTNEVTQNMTTGWDWQIENTLSYTFNIEKHNFDVLVGQSFKKSGFGMGEYLEATANHLLFSDWDRAYISNSMASQPTSAKGYPTGDNALASFFGRINYNWKNLLIASASIRYEGSTKFGADHKWGAFPSLSLAWEMANMGFLKDHQNIVQSLKPRVSYGVTGRSDFDCYQSLATYGSHKNAQLNVTDTYLMDGAWVTGYAPSVNANSKLGWEKSVSMNIGVDFALWNRLRGSVEWFDRQSRDLLYNYTAPQPPYIYSTILVNVGTTVNRGIEVSLEGDAFKGTPVEWTTGINYSYGTTKLDKLSNSLYKASYVELYQKPGVGTSEYFFRVEEGSKIGQFYGYEYAGVENGDMMIYTDEGEKVPVSKADVKYKRHIGNGTPTSYLSWSNTLRYKNFDLSLMFNGAFGFEIFNMRRYGMGLKGCGTDNVLRDAYGKDADITTGGGVISSFFLEKGDYFKLDNLTLGYTITPKENKFIKGMRVYLTAKNLFTLTGYSGNDPSAVAINGLTPGVDTNSAYPSATQLSVGLNIRFK